MKLIKHIREQNEPISIKKMYPPRIYLFVPVMIGLAVSIRLAGFSPDTLAWIYFAIAVGLLNGATDFLKEVLYPKKVIYK